MVTKRKSKNLTNVKSKSSKVNLEEEPQRETKVDTGLAFLDSSLIEIIETFKVKKVKK